MRYRESVKKKATPNDQTDWPFWPFRQFHCQVLPTASSLEITLERKQNAK